MIAGAVNGVWDRSSQAWRLPHPNLDPRHRSIPGIRDPMTPSLTIGNGTSAAEYPDFVEENYKAKSLIYRWKP